MVLVHGAINCEFEVSQYQCSRKNWAKERETKCLVESHTGLGELIVTAMVLIKRVLINCAMYELISQWILIYGILGQQWPANIYKVCQGRLDNKVGVELPGVVQYVACLI